MNIMMMPMATKSALPWMATAKPATVPLSRLLGETEFASIYAAADFAAEFQMPMDTLVTISWSLLGVTSDSAVQAAFTSFTKCLRDRLTNRVSPIAYIYAHEVGAVVGLHSHLAVFVAGERNRLEFRHWVRGWADRFAGRYIPRAVRVTGPRIDTPWLHWLRYITRDDNRGAERIGDRPDIRLRPFIEVGDGKLRTCLSASGSASRGNTMIVCDSHNETALARQIDDHAHAAAPLPWMIERASSAITRSSSVGITKAPILLAPA